MATNLKSKITKEAIAAYKRACAIRKSPIPADPQQRQNRQRAFHAASIELEQAVGVALAIAAVDELSKAERKLAKR